MLQNGKKTEADQNVLREKLVHKLRKEKYWDRLESEDKDALDVMDTSQLLDIMDKVVRSFHDESEENKYSIYDKLNYIKADIEKYENGYIQHRFFNKRLSEIDYVLSGYNDPEDFIDISELTEDYD